MKFLFPQPWRPIGRDDVSAFSFLCFKSSSEWTLKRCTQKQILLKAIYRCPICTAHHPHWNDETVGYGWMPSCSPLVNRNKTVHHREHQLSYSAESQLIKPPSYSLWSLVLSPKTQRLSIYSYLFFCCFFSVVRLCVIYIFFYLMREAWLVWWLAFDLTIHQDPVSLLQYWPPSFRALCKASGYPGQTLPCFACHWLWLWKSKKKNKATTKKPWLIGQEQSDWKQTTDRKVYLKFCPFFGLESACLYTWFIEISWSLVSRKVCLHLCVLW